MWFSYVFLIALAGAVFLQLWLIVRQNKHVADNRSAVPAAFTDKISLEDHQKAADYTHAKLSVTKIELFYGVTILLLWTFGGGLNLLDQLWAPIVSEFVAEKTSPMCGNSICQDRRFLARCMPSLEAYFHYRNLDVSTLKELAKRWLPKVAAGFKKKGAHLALDDIKESIEELRYYREHMIVSV